MSGENVEIVRRAFEELEAGIERGNISAAFDACVASLTDETHSSGSF